MAKKGRIERNERVKAVVTSQAEKRNGLKEKQREIFTSYSKQIETAKTEDEKKVLLQKASMELFQISVVFQKIKRDGSKTRVRNRCALTGRPRGYHGLFGISRNLVREAASFGLIMGLRKSSW
jgi:small subunit ribosomal protein S14